MQEIKCELAVSLTTGDWTNDFVTVSARQIYATQLMLYRRALLGAMVQASKHLKAAIAECVTELKGLKQAVGDSKSLSRDSVFPRFSRLAGAYHRAFQEGERLSLLEHLVVVLEDLAVKCAPASGASRIPADNPPRVNSHAADCKDPESAIDKDSAADEADTRSLAETEKLSHDGPVPELLDGEAGKQARCCLELAGNCLYCLAEHGALVPAGETARKMPLEGSPRGATARAADSLEHSEEAPSCRETEEFPSGLETWQTVTTLPSCRTSALVVYLRSGQRRSHTQAHILRGFSAVG